MSEPLKVSIKAGPPEDGYRDVTLEPAEAARVIAQVYERLGVDSLGDEDQENLEFATEEALNHLQYTGNETFTTTAAGIEFLFVTEEASA